jgi:hypothetical protein
MRHAAVATEYAAATAAADPRAAADPAAANSRPADPAASGFAAGATRGILAVARLALRAATPPRASPSRVTPVMNANCQPRRMTQYRARISVLSMVRFCVAKATGRCTL